MKSGLTLKTREGTQGVKPWSDDVGRLAGKARAHLRFSCMPACAQAPVMTLLPLGASYVSSGERTWLQPGAGEGLQVPSG